jgi:phage protein U
MSIGSFISGFVPMLRLGNFNFSLNNAVFQEMRRSAEYRWPGQDRFGQMPALQYTGPGEEIITLPGVIYPSWRGTAAAMANLRVLASKGQPQQLIDAQGNLYGRWVITSVEETRSTFAAFAQPRKVEFNVTLKHFDGYGDGNALDNLLASAISGALG